MTEQAKLPDGSVDIVDKVRKLEAFIAAIFDHRVFRDNSDGELVAFDIADGDGYPAFFYDSDGELIPDICERYDGDITLADWLQEQLHIDVSYDKDDDDGFSVSGWCIDITCGGPTVYLKRCPFSGCVTYSHSWGVVSWADPAGHHSPRTTIEFSSGLGDQIHEYIQEMYS